MTLADETAPEIAAHIKNALSVIHPEVSKFTFPLFAVDQRGRPVLYASSVLVTIDETVVLLTAAHAVHEITRTGSDLYLGAKTMVLPDFPWLTTTDSTHKQSKVATYSVYHGNSWRAKTITSIKTAFVCTSKNGRDALDLAATLIPDELLRTDAMHSLPQSKLCTPPYSLPLHIRCVHGYPVTKNKTRKRANESTNVFTKYSFTYAGAPHNVIDDYARYSKRDSEHIALKYQRQSRNDLSELVTPPSPKGISGGGLWSIPDSFNPKTLFLDGIAIEFHKNSIIFATRMEHVIAFVRQSVFPELLRPE